MVNYWSQHCVQEQVADDDDAESASLDTDYSPYREAVIHNNQESLYSIALPRDQF